MASIGPLPPQMLYQHQTPSAHRRSLLPNPVSSPTQHWTLVPPRFREYATQTLVIRYNRPSLEAGHGGTRHQQTLQIIRRTDRGNLSVSAQSLQRATIGWNGSLYARSPYKTLTGQCLSEQGNPLEGVEISAQGKTVVSDHHGRFAFGHLEGSAAQLKIHAVSLPFAMHPMLGYEQSQFLEQRKQHCTLTFYQTIGLRGSIDVQHTQHAALHQQIDLSSLRLTLYHEDSSAYSTSVLKDGQFTLGGLPEGHYCGALAPAPQGFSYEPIAIDIREGSPAILQITLVELPLNIPFQAL